MDGASNAAKVSAMAANGKFQAASCASIGGRMLLRVDIRKLEMVKVEG